MKMMTSKMMTTRMTRTKTRSNARADEAYLRKTSSAPPLVRLHGGECIPAVAANKSNPPQGDSLYANQRIGLLGRLGSESDDDTDQDSGDLPTGVDEDALDEDDLDTDRVTGDDESLTGAAGTT